MMILYLILLAMWGFQTYCTLPQTAKKVSNNTDVPVTQCHHKFLVTSSTTGIFMSPQFPQQYLNELDCVYFFQAAERGRIKITFDLFHLEGPNSDQGCQFDYIEIYNIDREGFKVLMDRYCGKSVPKQFISQESKLEIKFKTDFTKTLHGFLGHYEFLDENWHHFGLSTIGCGAGFHTGKTGIITSPNYPGDPQIPKSRCTWIVKVQESEYILIAMVDLDMTNSCADTFLMFFNGFTVPGSYPNERYCAKYHYQDEELEFLSEGSRIVIRYEANSQYSGSRFKLVWTAVTKADLGKCDQFLCPKTRECVAKENKGCTNPTFQYCIDQSMVCNSLPNCGVLDDSDESKCLNRLVWIIIYVAVPVSAIVLILIIALLCYRYRRRKQNVIKMEAQKPQQTHWVSPHIRTTDPSYIASQSATLLTTSFISDKHPNDIDDMTVERRKKIQNRTIENIKNSDLFNKIRERDKTVHYDMASNSDEENHDIVTHSIQLEPQLQNQGLRTHQKRPSYHMMQELTIDNSSRGPVDAPL